MDNSGNIFSEKEKDFILKNLESLYNIDLKNLSQLSAEDLFSEEEIEIINRTNQFDTNNSFLSSHLTIVMKATRLCNLRCKYCNSWKDGNNQKMTFEVLCKSIKDTLSDNNTKIVNFVWHGGETLIMSQLFYEKAIWLQNYYKKPRHKIYNILQTNATLLNESWITFFKKYNFSLGVSLDGPPEINDEQRIYKNGNPTSGIILEKLKLLQENNLNAGILLVIDKRTINYGAKNILNFLRDIEVKSIALLNVIPDSNSNGSFINFDVYVNFLIQLFDEWWREYKDVFSIRELSSIVNQINGSKPQICIYAGNCLGKYLTIEPEGMVSACDKYIGYIDYTFGNILKENLSYLIENSNNFNFTQEKLLKESKNLAQCNNFSICNGGCPHDNLLRKNGDDYFCCGLNPLINHIRNSILNN